VQAALARCLAGPLDVASLRALDQADQSLAAATRDHLVWEAYRIALNGLPMEDIRQHLELRRDRFRLALREAAVVSQAGEGYNLGGNAGMSPAAG
jgi:hypothetical protein